MWSNANASRTSMGWHIIKQKQKTFDWLRKQRVLWFWSISPNTQETQKKLEIASCWKEFNAHFKKIFGFEANFCIPVKLFILSLKQDFCPEHFGFKEKLLVKRFGCEATLFCSNMLDAKTICSKRFIWKLLFSSQAFHLVIQPRLLSKTFWIQTKLLFNDLDAKQDFCLNILNPKQIC